MTTPFVESVSKVKSSSFPLTPISQEIVFAGDHVCLAGQIDYPTSPPPTDGYAIMVILHHAGGNTRQDYAHYAQVALESGVAVFRWDKRGTGNSGAGGIGSSQHDAVKAYRTALHQPRINPKRAILLAQSEGSRLLGSTFAEFAAVQPPLGALLIGNLLNADQILAIQTRIQVLIGAEDWVSWREYGKDACNAHQRAYPGLGAAFSVAHHADRLLIDTRKKGRNFHLGAKQVIKDWLKTLR
ncbi:MAG: hypothetical protein MUF87_20960 [Anaerolineae bacterium]|jgi:alpha-beta hydrolase superfamily lysophospholipase|nr:hypothetical protein [Anaerolineae bacterium]